MKMYWGKGTSSPKLTDHQYEKCVLCGRLTFEKKETPIQMRSYYVPGAGQLCRD